MLTCQRTRDHIELVEADNAVDMLCAGDVRNCTNIIDRQSVIFNGTNIVDRRPRPGRIEQLFSRDQRDAPARNLGLFEKIVALLLAGDADDVVFHTTTGCQTRRDRQTNSLSYFYFASKEWHNL